MAKHPVSRILPVERVKILVYTYVDAEFIFICNFYKFGNI